MDYDLPKQKHTAIYIYIYIYIYAFYRPGDCHLFMLWLSPESPANNCSHLGGLVNLLELEQRVTSS